GPRHQPAADAMAARTFGDVEIFEIEPRPAEPGRKPGMEQCGAGGLAIEKGEDRLELRVRTEAVPAQILFARDDRVGRAFVDREFADQPQQQAAILRRRKADPDLAAHRSRHARLRLPGGPKSRGASPAWNHVTKL